MLWNGQKSAFKTTQTLGLVWRILLKNSKWLSLNPNPESLSRVLWKIRQGQQSVSDFSTDFCTIAAASGWDSCALKSVFINALNESLKDVMVLLDEPETVDNLFTQVTHIELRLKERLQDRPRRNYLIPPINFSPTFTLSPHPPQSLSLIHKNQNQCNKVRPSYPLRNSSAGCSPTSVCIVEVLMTSLTLVPFG